MGALPRGGYYDELTQPIPPLFDLEELRRSEKTRREVDWQDFKVVVAILGTCIALAVIFGLYRR